MPTNRKMSGTKIESPSELCMAVLDRVQVSADGDLTKPPRIRGFKVVADHFVSPQAAIPTRRRVQILENPKTKTKLYVQYDSVCSWLTKFKITVIAGKRRKLRRSEMERVLGAFKNARLLTVELAFDFLKVSGVDLAFVERYGIFGKSRRVLDRLYGDLRYGARSSATMVRAYEKDEIPSVRVEIEFHSSWLRKHGIANLNDLEQLAALTVPGRVKFARLDWATLFTFLSRRGFPAHKIITRARLHAHSIPRAMQYLRDEVGLRNVRRFLRPLKINHAIRGALKNWLSCWSCTEYQKAEPDTGEFDE
jgi:hypothetical protein